MPKREYWASNAEAKNYERLVNALLKVGVSKKVIAAYLGVPVGRLATGPIPEDWDRLLSPLVRKTGDKLLDISDAARKAARYI